MQSLWDFVLGVNCIGTDQSKLFCNYIKIKTVMTVLYLFKKTKRFKNNRFSTEQTIK